MTNAMEALEPAIHQPAREKRCFPRVNYRAYASLTTSSKRYPAHILDLSFAGALVALIHKHNLKKGEEIILNIDILETDRKEGDTISTIRMLGKLAHVKGHFLGIECRASGIDNQTRLRDLLEKHKDNAKSPERSLARMMTEYQPPY